MRKRRFISDQARLLASYCRLKKAYAEIKDSYSEMIFRFCLAAEYKDESTGTHLVKIADYSTEIARQLRLSESEVTRLRYASPMHDIGKLVIPDAIIKKPGGLTPGEREIIKKHAVLGAEIFKNSRSPLLKAARLISLTHHERYDGTGYPQGLKGREIPLFGRIVALADVFDALTSKRPYKEAYEFQDAIRIIEESCGTQFDPGVVKAFLKRKKKIKEILQATRDIEAFVGEQNAR